MKLRSLLLLFSLAAGAVLHASEESSSEIPAVVASLEEQNQSAEEVADDDDDIFDLTHGDDIPAPEIVEHSDFVNWFTKWRNRLGIAVLDTRVGSKMFDAWVALQNWVSRS